MDENDVGLVDSQVGKNGSIRIVKTFSIKCETGLIAGQCRNFVPSFGNFFLFFHEFPSFLESINRTLLKSSRDFKDCIKVVE
jgi:hypothetical protein